MNLQKTYTVEQIMEQAQVFASSWALVGGPFDAGDQLEAAELEKDLLAAMLTHAAGETESRIVRRVEKWPADKYDDRQRAWLGYYEQETGFEPVMEDYEEGAQAFVDAAEWNVKWFEDWSSDALSHVSGNTIPGSDFDLAMMTKEGEA